MFKKIVTIMTMLFAASSANAGIFGGPSEEELAKRRMDQRNCLQSNSVAYCVLAAGENVYALKDVEVPDDVYRDVYSQGETLRVTSGLAGMAVGLSQLSGGFPTIISRTGLGTLNVLGGIFALTKSANAGLHDRMIGFLPASEAADGATAHRKFEQAYIDAFVKTIPGATSAEIETFNLDSGDVATSYVVRGGECDTKRCVLWSPAWSKVCKASPCERNNTASRLVENGFLGDGKFWVPARGAWVVLLDSPTSKSHVFMNGSLRAPVPQIGGFATKLDLMQAVSANLPSWAFYFLAQMEDKAVPYPVVLSGGSQLLLIKPKKQSGV